MKRKAVSILLAAALVLALPVSVSADEGQTYVPPMQTVTYDGTDYTIGFSFTEGDRLMLRDSCGCTSSEGPFGADLIVGVMTNYSDYRARTEAPASFYDFITNIDIAVDSWESFTDGDDTPFTLSDPEDYDFHGCKTKKVHIAAKGNDSFFRATLRADVTLRLPEQEAQTYSVYCKASYLSGGVVDVDASSLDTAEKLNNALSGWDALMRWYEATDAKGYAAYQELYQLSNGESGINLLLPPVSYDGIIEAKLWGFINITGTENETGRTAMPGMRVSGRISNITNISFAGDEQDKQTYGEETFTCGVLAAGGSASVYRCSFTGLDCGVRSTPEGYISIGMRNVFDRCTCGVFINCAGVNEPGTNIIFQNRFVNNGTAVRVEALPETMSPYQFRIYDSDFINNTLDVDMRQTGTFYFYRNYFGASLTEPGTELTLQNVHGRTALVKTAAGDAGPGATVVTNPRRIDPATLCGWDETYAGRGLCIDPFAPFATVILNDMADELVIAGDSLASLEETVEILVTDDTEQSCWTFGGAEE